MAIKKGKLTNKSPKLENEKEICIEEKEVSKQKPEVDHQGGEVSKQEGAVDKHLKANLRLVLNIPYSIYVMLLSFTIFKTFKLYLSTSVATVTSRKLILFKNSKT